MKAIKNKIEEFIKLIKSISWCDFDFHSYETVKHESLDGSGRILKTGICKRCKKRTEWLY